MGKERDDVLGVPVAMSPAPGGRCPRRPVAMSPAPGGAQLEAGCAPDVARLIGDAPDPSRSWACPASAFIMQSCGCRSVGGALRQCDLGSRAYGMVARRSQAGRRRAPKRPLPSRERTGWWIRCAPRTETTMCRRTATSCGGFSAICASNAPALLSTCSKWSIGSTARSVAAVAGRLRRRGASGRRRHHLRESTMTHNGRRSRDGT
jgi:hypothetical protein